MTSTSPVGSLPRSFASAARSPGLRVLDDLPLDRRADPGEPRRLLVEGELRHGNGRLADARRRAAVGAQAESVRAVELEQVGEELELLGELGVRRQRLGHAGDDTRVRLVVCLPTYNERANLEPMVRALGEVLAGVDADARVLVIDDSSPDGTGELADRLDRRAPVPRRPPPHAQGGPRSGVRRRLPTGARAAAPTGSCQMDCDFSHDPADVPRLLAATEGAGLALGSRYVEGGGTENWGARPAGDQPLRLSLRADDPRRRRCTTSRAGSSASAARCSRRSPLDRIRTKGYAFQIETTYRAIRAGFEVVEVPIVFAERRSGGSKMTRGDRPRGDVEGARAPRCAPPVNRL